MHQLNLSYPYHKIQILIVGKASERFGKEYFEIRSLHSGISQPICDGRAIALRICSLGALCLYLLPISAL